MSKLKIFCLITYNFNHLFKNLLDQIKFEEILQRRGCSEKATTYV